MHLGGFYRIAWTLQLLVGITLFCVSFLIEGRILAAFFTAPILAWALALALETGKAAAIIFNRHLVQSQAAHYPLSIRMASATFRFGLIGLSILCSLLFLGTQLDRPHVQELRQAALNEIQTRLADDLARMDAEHDARLAARRERYASEWHDRQAGQQRHIAGLEALLVAEMDNVMNGVFKGPRYREIAARLADARERQQHTLDALAARHDAAMAQFAEALTGEHRQARTDRAARAGAERNALHQNSFDHDERAQDPRVIAFLRMSEFVFGWQINAPQFVFAFAIFLSLLMELGILLAFETLTLTSGPALAAQQREQIKNEELIAELAGSAERDTMRHAEAMTRVKKGAERVVRRAQAHARSAVNA